MINSLKEKLLQIKNRTEIAILSGALGDQTELYLVGGSIRDVAAGKIITDIDLATPLPPESLKKQLTFSQIRTIDTGQAHGTITALVNGNPIEITTLRARTDNGSLGFGSDILTDLALRDFSINAMAYHLKTGAFFDPYGGLADLNAGVLRAVGSAMDRIIEDPLRIMRMLRLGPAMGRGLEASLSYAAKELREHLRTVSIERVKAELERILLAPHPDAAFRKMLELDLLEIIIPELLASIGFEQNEFHTQDVFEHTLTVLGKTPPVLAVRLAALFHDCGKPATLSIKPCGRRNFFEHEVESARLTEQALKRLKFSSATIKQVSTLVRLHMRPLDCGPAGVRRLIRELSDSFEDWILLKRADRCPVVPDSVFAQDLDEFLASASAEKNRLAAPPYGRLAVNGNDLIELGFKPGPRLGAAIAALEQMVLENPEFNKKEVLLSAALKLMG